jgi:hypothetical protein
MPRKIGVWHMAIYLPVTAKFDFQQQVAIRESSSAFALKSPPTKSSGWKGVGDDMDA